MLSYVKSVLENYVPPFQTELSMLSNFTISYWVVFIVYLAAVLSSHLGLDEDL